MANYLFTGYTSFQIVPEHEEAARHALIRLSIKEIRDETERGELIMEKLPTRLSSLRSLPFDELIVAWGWSWVRDSQGVISGVLLNEDFSSSEQVLFATLAPFITKGSFIELDNTEEEYRYAFNGTTLIVQDPIYPPALSEHEVQLSLSARQRILSLTSELGREIQSCILEALAFYAKGGEHSDSQKD